MSEPPDRFRSQLGSFGMIPSWVLTAPIQSNAKVLFGWMACRYANRETWQCWPGQQRLADDLGWHRNTVTNALRELVSIGALTKDRRMTKDGKVMTNHYTLVFVAPPAMTKPATEGDAEDSHAHAQGMPYMSAPAQIGGGIPPQGFVQGYPQGFVQKPEVLEPESVQPERRASLIESPLQYHKRHGGHVDGFCDWVCLPQEMATQFANRARLMDSQVRQWAMQVRRGWTASGKVPTGSMWEFWNARWAEKMEDDEQAAHPNEGPVTRLIRLRKERDALMRGGQFDAID
jgi:hypothetical protein